jgi:hypothetical protein
MSVLNICAKTVCDMENSSDEIQHLWEMLRQNNYNIRTSNLISDVRACRGLEIKQITI